MISSWTCLRLEPERINHLRFGGLNQFGKIETSSLSKTRHTSIHVELHTELLSQRPVGSGALALKTQKPEGWVEGENRKKAVGVAMGGF